jgi:hypothetical protein
MGKFSEALEMTQLLNSAAFAKKQNLIPADLNKTIEDECIAELRRLFPKKE